MLIITIQNLFSKFPKRPKEHIFTVVNFIFIGEQAMESEHCLSHRKHPSTLSNSFKSLLFLSHFTFHISHTPTSPFHCFSTPLLFLKHPPHCYKLASLMMAPPEGRSYHLHGLHVAKITVVFIFFLSMLLPSKSGGISVMLETRETTLEGRKMVVGSKPPACVNKCMNCRPCMATVVVPNHQRKKGFKVLSRGEDDDTYYLLTWKCRCGNKLFQP